MSLKKHKRPELSVRNQGLLACKAAASHLIRFLQSFWLVFVIFIPIGYLLGHYTHVSLRQGVLSFLGLSEVYNIEWWYVRQYILMLLTLPLVDMAFDLLFSVKRKGFTALAGAAVLGAAALLAVYILGRRYTVRAYHFIFLIGYLCARFRIFEWIWKGLRTDIIRRLAGGTMVLACIGIRVHAASFAAYYRSDIVLAPVFVLGFCLLVPQTGRAAEGLVWLGKYSVYMWLVHTFYCYYYFQPMVTFSKISTVMYLVLILVSLLTAMGLCWTLKGLRRLTVGKVKV